MHWWFTNHAVILDTAGRLMFEEVAPGESSEWREFLSLLKKHRPLCPINGLFLTIGVDSIIRESADEIAKRAAKIAQQIDLIQRTLDVRFPVYVVVTKCDLLTGFREFFDELTDPQLQHQMFGWSNPDPLDSPFRAESVDQYLNDVVQKLRRRCLGTLRDPAPVDSSHRRIEEVDALYSLPKSISLISTRLRRYLENIFVSGVWSSKPLFLRGIYFTSSMREGSDLDQALADALQINVDELPQGRVWDKERAYFLRDLFTERVFRESGLVTCASNVSQMLRRRYLALYGFGVAALLVFGLFALVGMQGFRRSTSAETSEWAKAVAAHQEGRTVLPTTPAGSIDRVDGEIVEMNVDLRRMVEKPIEVSAVYRPINLFFRLLPNDIEQQRALAQRAFLEATFLNPLLNQTREKMVQSGEATNHLALDHSRRRSDALQSLIWFESEAASRDRSAGSPLDRTVLQGKMVGPLLSYLIEREAEETPQIANVLDVLLATYADGSRSAWPPVRLDGGQDLAANSAIRLGLASLVKMATEPDLVAQTNRFRILAATQSLSAFEQTEKAFQAEVRLRPDSSAQEAIEALQKAYERVEQSLNFLSADTLGQSLTDYQASREAALGQLQALVEETAAAQERNPETPLFAEILQQLNEARTEATNRIQQDFSAQDLKRMAELDNRYLQGNAYSNRWHFYRSASELTSAPVEAFGEFIRRWHQRHAPFRAEMLQQESGLSDCVQLSYAWVFVRQYTKLSSTAPFPLVRWSEQSAASPATAQTVIQVQELLEAAIRDQTNQLAATLNEMDGVSDLKARLTALREVASALVRPDQQVGVCLVSLPAEQSSRWNNIYRDIRINEESYLRAEEAGGELGRISLDQPLQIGLGTVSITLDPQRTFDMGHWGALEMLHRFDARLTEPGQWAVSLPMRQSNGATRPERSDWDEWELDLELKFDPIPPELSRWPRPYSR